MYSIVKFPTMDAINYFRMMYNPMNMWEGIWQGYTQTELDVPRSTTCPCCHKATADDLIPIMAINNADKNDNEDFLECDTVSIYRCSSCNNLYAIWSKHSKETIDDYSEDVSYNCKVIAEYPFNTNVTRFSSEINNLSSDFVKTYNQSELAENQGLDTICGMGYRRALEFLVDAYVRRKNPSVTINANDKLSSKISDYIDDNRIKTLAQKTTWLGNDQTHILTKHTDRDIQDMKKFIKAMITLIDCDFAFEDASSIASA